MNKELRRKRVWLAAAVIAVSGRSYAVEPNRFLLYNKGPVSLRPQLDLVEVFTDNVFYGDGIRFARKTDFITAISPGLNTVIGHDPVNNLTMSYAFDEFFYANNSQLNSSQHHFALGAHFEYHHVTVTGSDRVDLLSSVLGAGLTSLPQKITRLVNAHTYNVEYTLNEKTSVYGEGTYNAVDYHKGFAGDLLDSNSLIGTMGFAYHTLVKTAFFGEVYYGQTATTPNVSPVKAPHATFMGGFIGAKGDFTAHLTGTVKAGYEVRTFSDKSPAGNSPVVEVSLQETFTEKNRLNLTYSRRQQVSVQLARTSYVQDAIDISFAQILGQTGRFRAILQGGYDMLSYGSYGTAGQRNDYSIRAGTSLVYEIRRWAAAGLSYNFDMYRSDLPAIIDYNVNRVTLSLAIGF